MNHAITSFSGGYRFLSNFHLCLIIGFDGQEYPSVEHAYQAAKTFDTDYRQRIRTARTASEAKKLGKIVPRRDPNWDENKLRVMRYLVNGKFWDQKGLMARLDATDNCELIEGNTWGDTYWGCVKTPSGIWFGENHLGRLLMQARTDNRLGIDPSKRG